MTDPRCIPIGEPGGTWSKVVKRIERDGGPILPHTPPPTSDNAAILNEAGQNIAPVTGPHPHAETFGRNYVAQEVPGVDGYPLRIPIPVKPHLSSTPSELPAAPRLGVGPTTAETLELADELTAAGTPDETLVGEEMRAAVWQGIADKLTAAQPGPIPPPRKLTPAEAAGLRAAWERAQDHGRATFVPTVGFYEPPQPGWLARVIRRIFG